LKEPQRRRIHLDQARTRYRSVCEAQVGATSRGRLTFGRQELAEDVGRSTDDELSADLGEFGISSLAELLFDFGGVGLS
jgi:hypothetical protein